jgi:membrane-associated PAP2 superfamily phosphatase
MHRTLTAFVLALSLGTGAAPAALDSFWLRFSALWNGTKAGGGWDPSGLVHPAPADEGGGCDPSGRCSSGS